jgi:hypothetical protein
LLADRDLHGRLSRVADRLRASPGNERAAKLIERLATTDEPIVNS